MKRFLTTLLALALLCCAAPRALAQTEHASIGLGFHTANAPFLNTGLTTPPGAPFGVRWWLPGQKIAIDAGFGLALTPTFDDFEQNELGWTVEVGVPIVVKSWDRVHVLVRPGVSYSSQEVGHLEVTGFRLDSYNTFGASGEVEAEVFLADNFSVSASHGLSYVTAKIPRELTLSGLEETGSSLEAVGNNFTEVGFHIYLWGSH